MEVVGGGRVYKISKDYNGHEGHFWNLKKVGGGLRKL